MARLLNRRVQILSSVRNVQDVVYDGVYVQGVSMNGYLEREFITVGVALDCRQPKSAAYQLLNMKKSKSLKSEIEFNKWLKKTRAINTRVRIDHFSVKWDASTTSKIWSKFHME